MTGQEIKLLLSVVRAYDVPVRSDPDPLATHADGPKEALVHSYIEARFQVKNFPLYLSVALGKIHDICQDICQDKTLTEYFDLISKGGSARTTIAEGPNPAWNQQLTLTFKSANNDFSPDTLNRVKDCLYLHLFDEVKAYFSLIIIILLRKSR